MICKNCENNFKGKFCNNCGQKSNTKRVDYIYLINEISNSFLQLNHGIFYTIKELTLRPGNSIKDFLNGKRKQHFKPFAFLLLTSTIFIIIASFFNGETILSSVFSGISEGFASNQDKKVFEDPQNSFLKLERLFNWLLNNQTYLTLLLLPIFSLSSYLLFIKEKYNYIEHLLLNLYITGQQTVIQIIIYIFFIVFKIDFNHPLGILLILPFLYVFWVFIQFFNKKKFSTILLTILTYLLFYIISAFIILITLLTFYKTT